MSKDLTGRRFGRLTVIRPNPTPYISPSGYTVPRWDCRCDCGNETTVLQTALTDKNGTRSCGCLQRESAHNGMIDMTGQRFGRLTVLCPAELDAPRPTGQRMGWRCRCDCGNEIVTTRKDLLGGLQSCGCLLAETARKKIIEQNTVGHFDGTTISAITADRKPNKNNKSGVKGVYWSNPEKRWIAKIGVRGKSIIIGRFDTLEKAAEARKQAEEKYYKPILDEYEKQKNTNTDPNASEQ